MKIHRLRLAASIMPLLALFACVDGSAAERATVRPPLSLARGVNLENWTKWRERDPNRFSVTDFRRMRRSDFDFVRIVISGIAQLDDRGSVNADWLKTLDSAVTNATAAGLKVIIDEHDFIYCFDHGADCRVKLPQLWKALAERYQDAPPTVMFELLNEPKGEMNDSWNDTVADLIRVIRQTNPTRTIVVGPSHSYRHTYLDELRLPANDRNLLVTFHYYLPMTFSHQGAPWDAATRDLRNVTWGTPADKDELSSNFALVSRWAAANRRPILLGEFGAYDGSGTPVAQRAAYNAAVAREAERRGFAWCYWQFMGFNDFNGQWDKHMTPILKALVPAKRAAPSRDAQ